MALTPSQQDALAAKIAEKGLSTALDAANVNAVWKALTGRDAVDVTVPAPPTFAALLEAVSQATLAVLPQYYLERMTQYFEELNPEGIINITAMAEKGGHLSTPERTAILSTLTGTTTVQQQVGPNDLDRALGDGTAKSAAAIPVGLAEIEAVLTQMGGA